MSDKSLPTHASVVVIGGGVMGCSTLYHLAQQGIGDAILIERNQLTSGTTWHSAAQVRALRSTQNLTDLIKYSVSLYARLEEETGQATGWINKGSLSIATNPERLTHIRRQESLAHLFGVDARYVSRGEAKERWPLMNDKDVIGAVWSPDDGRVSPSDLCAALVKGARARGVRIFEKHRRDRHSHRGRPDRRRRDGQGRGALRCRGPLYGPLEPRGCFYGGCHRAGLVMRTFLSSDQAHRWHNGQYADPFGPRPSPLHTRRFRRPPRRLFRADRQGDRSGQSRRGLSPSSCLPEDWDHFEPMMMNALHRLPALETAEVKMLLKRAGEFYAGRIVPAR